MNLVDNGIKEVIKITRVITDEELYFLVDFIDHYNCKKQRKVMSIKNLESLTWME